MESFGASAADLLAQGGKSAVQESSIGEIHSLYQDLFLTDIKQEVEQAQSELKSCKQEQNTAQRDMDKLRKENAGLGATLKRYRQMLQDLTQQKKGGSLNKQAVNMLDKQQSRVSMGAGFSQLGKGGRMNRSESGSSLMSTMAANANQIDQVKIERLLTVFNLMQKNDNIMNIVMLTMRELKNLVVSQSIAIFVLTDDYMKGVHGIEEQSHGSLFK